MAIHTEERSTQTASDELALGETADAVRPDALASTGARRSAGQAALLLEHVSKRFKLGRQK
jgi:hypothetical protein